MTVREIASIAGVSPAVVSLVINNKKGVSEETRKRVQRVVEENNYSVVKQKRKSNRFRLVIVKYRTHGMAIEENQGFVASIIDQIESECRNFGFDLVMCNCDAKTGENTLRELMSNPPDGVILLGTELRGSEYALLDFIKVPMVVLDNNMHHMNFDSVVMANASIASKATGYLYQLGHREIGYFKSRLPIQNCEERYGGYLEAMEALGLTPPEPVYLTLTLNGAYTDMKHLLESGAYVPRGAVVADNDTIAIGAVKAIREAGYRIPEDMSIIGIDDIPFSAMTMPALTTMRISRSTLGILAVDMLRKRIKYPKWPSMHMQIEGNLIVRNSTMPVKSSKTAEES